MNGTATSTMQTIKKTKETQMLQKEKGASEQFHYELVSVICCLLLNNAD